MAVEIGQCIRYVGPDLGSAIKPGNVYEVVEGSEGQPSIRVPNGLLPIYIDFEETTSWELVYSGEDEWV